MTIDREDFVPVLRTDFERRDVGDESIIWSPSAAAPSVLDPVARVMLDVVDGDASIGQLATDVCEAVGVPLETAERQVRRIIQLFAEAGVLTASTANSNAADAIAEGELFASSPTPCAENSSRLGTVTLSLRLGEKTVRIACDSRRGARKLRGALADHIVDGDEDAALAFVLTAPQALKRTHLLVDRSGFVLSEGRGLDAGLHALACHLTALLPPAPGTVRIRTRGIVSGDRTIVCLFPLL
ncbi:MAG TPA: PqqD family protein, partial [Acidimicrobiia bacterium]|nr:PqqD family protein [Acidimicrobiia bacterium]